MDPRQETGERGDRHEGPGAETVDGFHMPEAFTCPECGGVMRRERDGRPRSFRCTVGHVLTGRALWLSQLQGAEYHLWAALRVLEEAASLGHRLVADGDDGIREPGDLQIDGMAEQIRGVEQRIDKVRDILEPKPEA